MDADEKALADASSGDGEDAGEDVEMEDGADDVDMEG